MQSSIWLAAGVVLLGLELRRRGPGGVRRFHALEPDRARALVDSYSSRWQARVLLVWAALNVLNGAIDLAEDQPRSGAVGLLAGAVLGVVCVLQRQNRSMVLREAEHRDLPSSPDVTIGPRDASDRRRRRQHQFGGVAIAALLLAPVAFALAALLDSDPLVVAGSVALAVGVLAGLGLGWATAWVYGDERSSTPDAA